MTDPREDEIAEDEIFDDEPDDLPRAVDGVQDYMEDDDGSA